MEKKFIILADDDVTYSSLYKTILIEQGWEVKVAENGQVALDLMREKKPDLLLLDLDMPVKSGFDVLGEIKSDSKLSQVVIIVMTNLSDYSAVARAMEFGAKNYFIKIDNSNKKMIDIIKKYLD